MQECQGSKREKESKGIVEKVHNDGNNSFYGLCYIKRTYSLYPNTFKSHSENVDELAGADTHRKYFRP